MPLSIEERKELRAATDFIRRMLDDSKLTGLHKKHFSNSISMQMLRKYLKDPNILFSAQPQKRNAILKFYRESSGAGSPRSNLYRALANGLEIGDQTGAAEYEGQYVSYRRSAQSGELVSGDVKIWRDARLGFLYFEHRSEHPIVGDVPQRFDHEGPVFVLSTRIYLIGIGTDSYGSYLRPIIVRAVDDPRKKELEGILLTEMPDQYVPFASPTILVHRERKLVLEGIYGAGFDQAIKKRLKPNYFDQGVLRGW